MVVASNMSLLGKEVEGDELPSLVVVVVEGGGVE
jgi:hypothetical protein